jgi:O-methyltransferase
MPGIEELIGSFVLPGDTGTSPSKLRHLLKNLKEVVELEIEGDVVELGCHHGSSSIFIRALLDALGSNKAFHVYDSWQGVPAPSEKDLDAAEPFGKGACMSMRGVFEQNLKSRGLALPVIHSGWFAEIPDNEYPSKIAFAFFDGDLYSSIRDSFVKVYHKLTPGARVVIDDYGWERTPGVKRACDEFLVGKESVTVLANYNLGRNEVGFTGGGLLIKS